MRLYARYVAWEYFKAFLIIFFALELFYVGIDVLTNLKEIPSSANIQLIYIGFTALSAISYVLPISLVFAVILSKINMIRANELVSFYALGVSKNQLIVPPFLIALIITLIFVALNFTPFAYSYEFGRNIIKERGVIQNTSDTFVKFDGKFIYIKELNAIKGEAYGVEIFDLNASDLILTSFAKSAKFSGNAWYLSDANQTILPTNLELGADGLKIKTDQNFSSLEGFKPKSIQSANVEEKSSMSALDALDFIFTFKNEGIALNSAQASFYTLVVFPFFAPFLVLILYYYLPVTGRFFNLALSSFIFVLVTLIIWGVLFVLIKFSQNATILPEIGILLPIVLMFLYAIWLAKRHH